MLPKPEKTKQLDLVGTPSSDKQVASKRRLLIFIMGLTILLPLAFMLYRLSAAPPAAYPAPTPSFEFFGATITSALNQNTSGWAFYLGRPSLNLLTPLWSLDSGQIGSPEELTTLLSQTEKSAALSSGPIFDLLPRGLNLRQLDFPSRQLTSLYIDIPRNPLFIVIKFPSADSTAAIPPLINQIYWEFVSRF